MVAAEKRGAQLVGCVQIFRNTDGCARTQLALPTSPTALHQPQRAVSLTIHEPQRLALRLAPWLGRKRVKLTIGESRRGRMLAVPSHIGVVGYCSPTYKQSKKRDLTFFQSEISCTVSCLIYFTMGPPVPRGKTAQPSNPCNAMMYMGIWEYDICQ